VLTLSGEEVEETEIEGFDSEEQTFCCSNVSHDQLLQVSAIKRHSVIGVRMMVLCVDVKPIGLWMLVVVGIVLNITH